MPKRPSKLPINRQSFDLANAPKAVRDIVGTLNSDPVFKTMIDNGWKWDQANELAGDADFGLKGWID